MKRKPDNLTQQQFEFLENWIQTGDITKSAVKAGYSKKTATVQGSRFLASIKAKEYITARLAEMNNEKIATSDEILQFLTAGMRGEIKEIDDREPTLADRTRCADLLSKIIIKSGQSAIPVKIVNDIPRRRLK